MSNDYDIRLSMEPIHDNIVELLKKRHPSSFENLYKETYRELFNYAMNFVCIPDIAHDIIQETFTVLLERVDYLNCNTNIRGYLYLTVKNKSLNHLKHYNIVVEKQSELYKEQDTSCACETSQNDDIEKMLSDAIQKLPTQQRIIISMRLLGKSYQEISESLGISEQTVNVHVKRAYKFLRRNVTMTILLFIF